MKKILLALMALTMVSMGFSSCDNNLYTADPTTQPIAGKTYRETVTADSYTQFTFHMNYKCTLVAKQEGQAAKTNPNFEWYMAPNDTEVTIRYAQGAYDTETGEPLSGKIFLSGPFDAKTKTVSLTGEFRGEKVTYNMTEL